MRLTHAENFALLLEGARSGQSAAQIETWERSLTQATTQGRKPIDAASVALLERLLALPADTQASAASCAAELSVRPCSPRQRLDVFDAVINVARQDAEPGLRELRRSLAFVVAIKAKRGLLFALHTYVPPGSRLHFLRAAEYLLQSGNADDLRVVRDAAKASATPVAPRGRTNAEREAEAEAEAELASSSAADTDADADIDTEDEGPWEPVRRPRRGRPFAPDVTDDDLELMQALMNEECDRIERLGSEGETEVAAAPAATPTSVESVYQVGPESVQNEEAIALTKQGWQYLAARYRRELPEEALFLLVHGAYTAMLRAADEGDEELLANAFPNQEKEWPVHFDKERKLAYLVADRERAAHVGRPELTVRRVLRATFEGRGYGRMANVLDDDDMSHHLDEEQMTTQRFLGIVWSVMHRRGEEAAAGSEDEREGELQRKNLRHSFWRGLADNVLVHVHVEKKLQLERLCHNGLAQRMLERFEGYEPFTVHPTPAGKLLSILSEKFVEQVVRASPDGEVSVEQVRDFVVSAREAARHALSSRRMAVFEHNLAAYLHLDFSEVAEPALSLADTSTT